MDIYTPSTYQGLNSGRNKRSFPSKGNIGPALGT